MFADGDVAGRCEVNLSWVYNENGVDWYALSDLYRAAPLGDKSPKDLKTVFANSMFKCFVYDDQRIVGAGRALADGADCSYICDVAVHPDYQGRTIGKRIVEKLVSLSTGHNKILLYANPGKEGFYAKLGFCRMNTAMAIFRDRAYAVAVGLVESTSMRPGEWNIR